MPDIATAQDVNTWCHYATQDELAFLRLVATGLPDNSVLVMLGAGPGVMALSALEGNRTLNVFVVDKDTCRYLLLHAEQCGLPTNKLNTRECDSADAGHEWDAGTIDLLIIDADHSYGGVSSDIRAWLPHLAVNGIVFFHDYDATGTEFADQDRYYGVMRAVDERIKPLHNMQFMQRVGTAIAFRKVGE